MKTDTFSHFYLQTKVWMSSTWAISYTINLLKLWFHLISKITLFLLFHIPTLHPLHPTSLIINVYCRTSALMTSKLNLLIILATILSPFKYSAAGHDITGDLSIIDNEYLRNILVKCPKYREPQSINRKYNFKLMMDSVEDYTRKWTKREKEGVDTPSEWVKTFRSVIQIRIGKTQKVNEHKNNICIQRS